MKTIRPKQTSSSIKEQDNILPLTDRVEMNNGLYTNRETRARSVSTVTLRSKHDGIKNSAKQELTKTLSNFKPNLKRSSIPKEHKTLNEFSKEYLPPAERIRNSPIKILRAKSINIVPASFDNSPYQECVDVGVYKYSGIHKGSVGRVQLTLKESNEHKLNKNNKSPIDISIPSGSPKGRESLKFFRPQKSSLKIGFENNKNPGNRIQQENKAFESLLRSLEESSGGSRELKEELKEKVEVTSTKEQKEQKPNKMLFYSRQLTAQTYLFNKNMMLGQKDEIEGDKIENRKELSGRLNSHFLLSDLIKKRKR